MEGVGVQKPYSFIGVESLFPIVQECKCLELVLDLNEKTDGLFGLPQQLSQTNTVGKIT